MLFLNDPFNNFDRWFGDAPRPVSHAPGAMDSYRRGDEVWIHIDLPGVDPEGIEIDVERNMLTVNAERKSPMGVDDQPYLSERTYGRIERRLQLGDGLDSDDVSAQYCDGVLTLHLAVAEKARPKRISIRTDRNVLDAKVKSKAD